MGGSDPQRGLRELVVYTSQDEIYAREIFKRFEQKTSIRILADYDTEANKSVGMVSKLLHEKAAPKCDVYWNNQVERTIQLKNRGVLAKTLSLQAAAFEDKWKDPEGYWLGFAARIRVLVYDTEKIKKEELPRSILELRDGKWKGKVAIAYPLFGTTASHAAALFCALGEEGGKKFFEDLLKNEVQVLAGNAQVKDAVVDGTALLGLTDTDDVCLAQTQGAKVHFHFLDQEEGGLGVLLIPNTVSLIQGAVHPQEAQEFIDFLLSKEVEEELARLPSKQIPLRRDATPPKEMPAIGDLKTMKVSFEEIAKKLEWSDLFLQKLFAK